MMNARPRFRLMSLSLLIVLLFSGFITTRQVYANSSVNVEISTFHDALAPYGNWVNHPLYGQVWYPRNVAQDWRPYTDGYWAYTDDYGWLWVSNEPWGWAPFHYGRWAWDNWYGWVWVPGRTWAPAWVFWRSGGGYAAWAPMPPNVVWQPGVGLNISYFNYDRDLRWDSWVAVREYDLPNRHISRHISPPSQNRQIINVTNYTNNVTLINNTIVNQGVPVKQIEEVTRRPVESVVPKVHDRVDINTAEQHEGQPDIIRLPMTGPTHEEIQHNEELARRLDGKNADGTRADLPVADVGQSGNQESRLPGRLVGAPAPVQSPYATPEQRSPVLTEPVEQALPLSAIPKTPLVGLSLDPDPQPKEPKVDGHQEKIVPVERFDRQSSATIQPIAPALSRADSASATDQKSVSTDAAMLPLQNERQPSESAKRVGNRPLQDPVADQQPIESQQTENLQRQQKIDQLQEELARRQDKQKQQDAVIQQQQVERAVAPAQQIQQPEPTRQPDMQNQQQPQIQPQQVERMVEPVQQIQQPEAVRQPDMQNQPQQAERARADAQQMQEQESARQQERQNQQQVEIQQQQAERARADAQQMQEQESARQQELQNQQQVEIQQQQAERARADALQMQQQESARQQKIDKQRQSSEGARSDSPEMNRQQNTIPQ